MIAKRLLLTFTTVLLVSGLLRAAYDYPPDAERSGLELSPRHTFRVEYWNNQDIWLIPTNKKASRVPFLTPIGKIGSEDQGGHGGGDLHISPDEKYIAWHRPDGHWIDELYLYKRTQEMDYVPCLDLQTEAYKYYSKIHHLKVEIAPDTKEPMYGLDTYDSVLGWSKDSRTVRLEFLIDSRPHPAVTWDCTYDVKSGRFVASHFRRK